jgi:hypothetical protein
MDKNQTIVTVHKRHLRTKWSRHTLGALVLVIAGMLALTAFQRESSGGFEAPAHNRPFAPVCRSWDEAASRAIAHLAQSKSDGHLRQVSDAIARMRRARRSCELGWFLAACQDYEAIVRSASEGLSDPRWNCKGAHRYDG